MPKNEENNKKIQPKVPIFLSGINVEQIESVFWAFKCGNWVKNEASSLEVLHNLQKSLESLDEQQKNCELSSEGIDLVIDKLLPMLNDDSEEVSRMALNTMTMLLPFVRKAHVTPDVKERTLSLTKIAAEKLIIMRDANDSRWQELYCFWIRILLEKVITIKEMALINNLLKVVQDGLKQSNFHTRAQSFQCWTALMKILVAEKGLCGDKIQWSAIPLIYTTNLNFNVQLAEARFSTWWYFLCHTKGNIQKLSSRYISPFLHFCFWPYRTYRENEGNQQLMPGKMVPDLHGKVVCALIHLLGVAGDATKALREKYPDDFEGTAECIIDKEMFRDIPFEIIQSCQEATFLLQSLQGQTDDPQNLCRNLWKNLMLLIDDTLKCVRLLCDVLDVFRAEYEKNINFRPFLQIMLDEMLTIDYDQLTCPQYLVPKLLYIFGHIIDFLLNTPARALQLEHPEKISKFLFKLCGKSPGEDIFDKLLEEITTVDIMNRTNISSFYTFFGTFVRFMRKHERQSSIPRKMQMKQNISERIFTWMHKSYKAYPNDRDFIRDFEPICREVECMRIKTNLCETNLGKTEEEFLALILPLIQRDTSKPAKTDEDSFVEITPKSTKIFPLRTNVLTDSQKDKMYKRAEDIPALYNDLTGDSMPLPVASSSASNSVIEATLESTPKTSKNKWTLRELAKLKTETIEGQNILDSPRSTRRKTSLVNTKEMKVSKDEVKDDTPDAKHTTGTRRSKRICGEKSDVEASPVKVTVKPKEMPKNKRKIHEKCEKIEESAENPSSPNISVSQEVIERAREDDLLSLLGKLQKSPVKNQIMHDHLYHLQKSPIKRPRIDDNVGDVNEELVSQMIRNVMNYGFHVPDSEENNENLIIVEDGLEDKHEESLINDGSPIKSMLTGKSLAVDSTQNIFPDTQEEVSLLQQPHVATMNISQADTEIQTPVNDTLSESLNVHRNSPVPADDTIQNTQNDTLQNTVVDAHKMHEMPRGNGDDVTPKKREESQNLLAKKIIKKLPQKNDGKSPKHSRLEGLPVSSSPKFTSRAAQMLSMTTSSPSSSKQEMCTKKYVEPPVTLQEDLFHFSTVASPLNITTPKLGILKRKRDAQLNDSTDMMSKKRRISFHDPPVTKITKYILDDNEKSMKRITNESSDLRRNNLLKDSPKPPEVQQENDGNDSDWEDCEIAAPDTPADVPKNEVSVSNNPPTNRAKKRSVKKLKKPKRKSSQEESSSQENHEVPKEKMLFFSDDQVTQYVWDNCRDKFVQCMQENPNEALHIMYNVISCPQLCNMQLNMTIKQLFDAALRK